MLANGPLMPAPIKYRQEPAIALSGVACIPCSTVVVVVLVVTVAFLLASPCPTFLAPVAGSVHLSGYWLDRHSLCQHLTVDDTGN